MTGWNSLFVAAHIKLILRRLEIFEKVKNSVCNVGIQGGTRNWVGHWPTCPSPFPLGLRTRLLLCCSSYAAMLGPGPALLAWRHCHLTGNCWPLGQPPTLWGAKMSLFGKHIHTLRGPHKHGGSTVCKEILAPRGGAHVELGLVGHMEQHGMSSDGWMQKGGGNPRQNFFPIWVIWLLRYFEGLKNSRT